MHHPGPPRFLRVGESVELAPRAPDPSATYAWEVVERPGASTATVDAGPVVHLSPDVPGTYRVELDGPDGAHTQTVRVFPDPREETRFSVHTDDVEGDLAGIESASVIGRFNDFTMGRHRAHRESEEWTLDVALPPGEHEAIFAFGDAFDPFITTETVVDGPGRPRVRLDGRREGEEVIVTATAQAPPDGADPDVEFHLDDRDPLAADDVRVGERELRIPVDELSALSRVHAVAVGERHSIADTLAIHADASFDRPADAPPWIRDATIYEIFVREFAGETVDTTFEAIERRVPYLEWLGVDVVWLTPVCESPTRHGYHITDLFDTASDLGTPTAFRSLVDRFHEADIKVIFDLVLNHTSRDHPAFQLHRADVPEYADHYERVPASRDTSDIGWAGDDAPGYYFTWTQIPNLNYDSLAVRDWMLAVIEEWAPLVDGFRCDVAWGVPHGFWKEVRDRLKAHDPEFLLLDETVPRDPAFRENEFDVHYDTDLYSTLREIGTGNAPAARLFDALEASRRHGYPEAAVHMRYLENHDEERYSTACADSSLRAAAAATFTLPGVPMIYYGQERGVTEQRGTMRWHDGDAELTTFHRRLVELRQNHPALRATGVERIGCDVVSGDPDRVVAYERSNSEETLVIVLNFGDAPVTVALACPVEPFDLLTDTEVGTDAGVRIEDSAVLRAR